MNTRRRDRVACLALAAMRKIRVEFSLRLLITPLKLLILHTSDYQNLNISNKKNLKIKIKTAVHLSKSETSDPHSTNDIQKIS